MGGVDSEYDYDGEREPMTLEELLERHEKGEESFKGVIITGANLADVDLGGVDLAGANLDHAELPGAVLGMAYLADACFEGSNPTRAVLTGATLAQAKFHGTNLERARMGRANLARASFASANLHQADLEGADLRGARFESCSLYGVSLYEADLSGAHFFRVDLRGANLLDVTTDTTTSFFESILDHAVVRAHTVIDLDTLTPRQRMRLEIRDSLADLRRDYSGFWLWVHLIALVLFLSPYIAFITRASLATAMSTEIADSASALGVELGWYILSAGSRDHTVSPWALAFLFGILYNGLRAAMLYKTHTLALQHELTGLPLTYVLEHDPRWFRTYKWAKRLFWLNVLVALSHFGMALREPVVLSPVREPLPVSVPPF